MLSPRSILILAASALLLPLLGLAAWLWQQFYRDNGENALRRIFKNSAVPTAMRMLVRLLDLLFALVLYDVLGATQIGPYDLAALFVVQFLGTCTDFGLGVLLTREVAKDRAAAPRLFGVTLALRLLLVGATIPLILLLIGGYAAIGASGFGTALSPLGQTVIWILALTLIPSAFSNAVTALYNANERMEVPALLELFTAIVSNIARVAVLALGLGVLGLAWVAVVVTTLVALVYLGLQMRDFFAPRIRWDWPFMRLLLPTALPLMLNNLLTAIFFRFDIFIVRAFGAGNADTLVAQYNQAYKIIGIAMIVPPVITFAVFPTLARRGAGNRAALAEAQNRTLQVLLLLALPLTVGIAVLAPDLVRLMGGSRAAEYLPISAQVLAILVWFLPLSFVNGLLQYVLIAIDRQRLITRAFVIGAVFNLLANLVFIPRFGLFAAAIITILSEIVLLLAFWPVLAQEQLAPPLGRLFWRPVAAALVMGGAMVLAGRFFGPTYGWLGAGLVAAPVYAAMLGLLGAFGSEERALVRRMFGRNA